MEFSKGEMVFARYPNTKRFVRAVVVDIKGKKYKVKSEEGEEVTLAEEHLMPQRTSRRMSGRAISPVRQPQRKSPARRSPLRRSPARRTPARRTPARSPARSPARTGARSSDRVRRARSIGQTTMEPSVSYASIRSRSATQSGSRDLKLTKQVTSTEAKSNLAEEISDNKAETETGMSSGSEDGSRQVTNLADEELYFAAGLLRPLRESSHFSSVSTVTLRKAVNVTTATQEEVSQSEEELEPLKDAGQISELLQKMTYSEKPNIFFPVEFGGWLGALILMLLLPSIVFGLQLYYKTIYKGLDIPTDWTFYFNIEILGLYAMFFVVQTLLSLVPIGKVTEGLPDKLGRHYYRFNGGVVCLLTLSSVAGIHFYWCPVTVLNEKYIQLLVSAIVFAFLTSMFIFIRSGRASVAGLNPYGCTYNNIYDFWMGRELNPRCGKLDFKTAFLKTSLIINVVLYEVMILKIVDNEEYWNVSFLVTVVLQALYIVQILWHEEFILSTFYVLYEGCGYMFIMGCGVYPFFTTVLTKYLLENRLECSIYAIIGIGIFNSIGFIIYLASNSEKFRFRTHAVNPFIQQTAIPTTRGKKLLVSGWWGFVRHPNYLGDIVMHWSWIGACGFTHWLPYSVPVLTTVILLHRAKRDEARCKQRYGDAWNTYCNQVKSRVIPFIF